MSSLLRTTFSVKRLCNWQSVFATPNICVKYLTCSSISMKDDAALQPRNEKRTKQITIRNNDSSQKAPLVIIFGWGNGKLNHLLKYSDIFEKKNFTTMCVTTSLVNSLLRTSTAGRKESVMVRKVMDELISLNPDRPILLYPFSNAGCAIYYLLIESFTSQTFPGTNIKGTIFDSCPIIPNEESAEIVKKAFGQNQNFLVRSLLAPLIKLAVLYVVRSSKDVKHFMKNMEQSKLTSPQLFLFSKQDSLAPYNDIVDFIEKRKEIGVDTHYQRFDDSDHVGHFRKHHYKYVTMVNEFVDKLQLDKDYQ